MDSDSDSDVTLNRVRNSSNNSDETFETNMEEDVAADEVHDDQVEIEVEEEQSDEDEDDKILDDHPLTADTAEPSDPDQPRDGDDDVDDDDYDDYDEDEPLDAQLRNAPSLGGPSDANDDGLYEDDPGSESDADGSNDDNDDDDDDDDDDVPLSARTAGFSRLKKRQTTQGTRSEPKVEPKDEPEQDALESDSDDDVPLAARLPKPKSRAKEAKVTPKKRAKAPPAKAPPTKKRRTSTKAVLKSKGTATAKTTPKRTRKPKKPKKDEDVPVRKFEKPGQRKEAPAENDPARLFYQSMYEEKRRLGKQSSMAETWMLRHGLLRDDVAERVLKRLAVK